MFPLAIPLIQAGVGLFGSIFGAKQQSDAGTKAAQIQADAMRYAADQQQRAYDAALAYQRQQSDRDFSMAETNRRANYDQWASREKRIGSLGALVGLPAREIPGYVPFNGSGGAAGASSSFSGELDPKAAAIISQAQAELPPTAASMNEIVKRLNAAGFQTTVPTRATGALSDDKFTVNGQMFDSIFDVGGPNARWQLSADGGGAPASSARQMPTVQPGSLGSYAALPPATAALQMPMPGSLADYLQQRRFA